MSAEQLTQAVSALPESLELAFYDHVRDHAGGWAGHYRAMARNTAEAGDAQQRARCVMPSARGHIARSRFTAKQLHAIHLIERSDLGSWPLGH